MKISDGAGNETIHKIQDDGSGLSALRIVIEDEDEKYAKVAWNESVSGNKFKGEITWDGKFKDGTIAPTGEYLVWVKVTDTAGNERIGLGKVIVLEPNTLFSIFKTETTFKGTPAQPQELFDPNANPSAITTPPTQSFGGLTTETKDNTQTSISLVSGTAAIGKTTTSSNVLWGATAAAMAGALTAYILDEKRKREEEQEREAALQAQETERRAKMKEQKMAKLEAKWAQEKMWEQARLEEQQAKTQQDATTRMEAKMEHIEAGEDAKWIASQVAIREQAEARQKAEVSQAGLAAYYNARKQGETTAPMQEQSWWENTWDTTKSFVQDKIVQPTHDAWNSTITTLHNSLALSLSNIFSPDHNTTSPKVQMRFALDNDPPLSKWDQFWQNIKDWWNQPWFWEKQRLSAQTPTPNISAIQTQAVQTVVAQFTQTAQVMLTPTPSATPFPSPTTITTSIPTQQSMWVTYRANFRSEPTLDANVLGLLEVYSSAMFTGQIQQYNDISSGNLITFYQIIAPSGQVGWVASNFLEANNPSSAGMPLGIDPNKKVIINPKFMPTAGTEYLMKQDLMIGYNPVDIREYASLMRTNGINFNLCGEFVAAYLSGQPIDTLINDWINQTDETLRMRARNVINDPKMLTGLDDLQNMLDQYGCTYNDFLEPLQDPIAGDYIVTPARLKAVIDRGYSLIVGVHVDQSGKLVNNGTVPHWIVLDDISPQGVSNWQPNGQVLIYNSMSNSQEISDYQTFLQAAINFNDLADAKKLLPNGIRFNALWVDSNSCK